VEEKVRFLENALSKRIICIIFLFFLQHNAVAGITDSWWGDGTINSWGDLEAFVEGEHLKVISVAYEPFSKKLNDEKDVFRLYAGKLENHGISVYKGNKSYKIVFYIKGIMRWIIYDVSFETYKVSETPRDDITGESFSNFGNSEAFVEGKHLKAILIAYKVFLKKLNDFQQYQPKHEKDVYNLYASKLENYGIFVYKENKSYKIVFKLKLNEDYPAFLGSAKTIYKVDLKTYKVSEIHTGK
jgi:hypothetical protein